MVRDGDGIVDFVVEREGQKIKLNGVNFNTVDESGIKISDIDFGLKEVKNSPLRVISNTGGYAVSIGRYVWLSLYDIVTGKFGLAQMSGPVGVVDGVADTASAVTKYGVDGVKMFLLMLSMITINIGLFNLFPIPALDGSRIVFLIVEKIRRKPLNRKIEAAIHAGGMILLLGFMLIVTVSDVGKFF
jgi:regulator of sigma E protease